MVLVCGRLFGAGHLIAKKRLQAAENLKEKQEELWKVWDERVTNLEEHRGRNKAS